MKQSLPQYLGARTRLIEVALDRWLPRIDAGPAPRLHEAMRYSVMAGGKRLRPILLLLVAETCGECELRLPSLDDAGAKPGEPSLASVLAGGRAAGILRAACALEVLHTYSLIHDDLPAMDDDDLRRGRPTNHKIFGEALAILAGDALLTLAFEWLARAVAEGLPASRVLSAMYRFAEAVGHAGMVGGQALDMAAENRVITMPDLETIHRAKTGALLRVAVEMGGLLAGATEVAIDVLRDLGTQLGLLFQITDDILDEVGTATELGKRPGVDRERGKATYPGLLGLDEARRRAAAVRDGALASVAKLPRPAPLLHDLVHYCHDRCR